MPKPIKRLSTAADGAPAPLPKVVSATSEEQMQTNNQIANEAVLSKVDLAKMDEVIARSHEIDATKVSAEILDWLINNVDEYIDNSDTIHRIYFKPDVIAENTEAGKLQALFMGIPDTGHPKEMECIAALEAVVSKAKEAMDGDSDRLKRLFDKMVFFYDTKFTSVNGKLTPLTMKMDGEITIHEFLFDTVSQKVQVVRKNVALTRDQIKVGNVVDQVKKAVAQGDYSQEVIEIDQPQGYSVELEITCWPESKA